MNAVAPYDASTPQNMLLEALPTAEWDRVRKNLRRVFMPLGRVLAEPAMPLGQIYFPMTAVIAISCVINDGHADAVTLVGREGFAGVEFCLGGDLALFRATVLREGWCQQIRRECLCREYDRGASMQGILRLYTQSYITQVAQTSVCNRHHTIDQQVCRWLLMFLDCQSSNDLALTHEHIAELIGVRRESVTQATVRLQMGGIIRYSRGHISVLDRSGLEAHACECHRMVKRETDRLLEISRGAAQMAAAQAAGYQIRSERLDRSNAIASTNTA